MKLVKKGEGKRDGVAPRHFNMWSLGKTLPEMAAKRLNVGLSHFLPGGGAEMAASAAERVYYGISGSLMVRGKEGEEYLVEPGDVLYIPPGEERSIETAGTEPATVLVVIVKLD